MAIPVLQSMDFNLLELLNPIFQNLAAAPAHKGGRVYYDTALKKIGVSDGTTWTYLSAGVTANSIVDSMVNTAAAINADKLADGTTNKVLLATERTKLTGIATGATANSTDAILEARANHTGTQSADTLTAGTTNKLYLQADVTKLAGIAAGATVNSTDAVLEARANHTGTQVASTISDFSAAADARTALITPTTLGLGNVNNTSDASKPVSTAQAAADTAGLARANHTGTQSADTILDGTTNKILSAANATKLTGIATGATANQTDAYLIARGNATGTQLASTISDFSAAADARIQLIVGAAPAALDTLTEIAAALGNDGNYAATMTTALSLKAATSSLAPVATAGTYASLTGKPSYSVAIGDGAALAYVVTHNLNTRALTIDVANSASPWGTVLTQVEKTTVNTVTVTFATAPAAGAFTVTVLG